VHGQPPGQERGLVPVHRDAVQLDGPGDGGGFQRDRAGLVGRAEGDQVGRDRVPEQRGGQRHGVHFGERAGPGQLAERGDQRRRVGRAGGAADHAGRGHQ
jgi:hypothetical protein